MTVAIDKEAETVNANEAARRLGVHRNTIYAWLKDKENKRLKGIPPGPDGDEWRIPVTEIDRISRGWRAKLDQFIEKSDAAQTLLKAAKRGYYKHTNEIRILCRDVLDVEAELTKKADADPVVIEELMDTFDGHLEELSAAITARKAYYLVGVEAIRQLEEADQLGENVEMEFKHEAMRREVQAMRAKRKG